jgi:hypothetical protein
VISARRIFLALVVLLASQGAWAQTLSIKDGILGAWSFVSVVSQSDDGRRGEPFGTNPQGTIIFTPDGRFSLFQASTKVPRLAANDRARASPEEAMAVVRESIAYYGRYTINEIDSEISLIIEGSIYANLIGPNPQRRVITEITAMDLAFSNPRTPSGVTLHTVWRRAAP